MAARTCNLLVSAELCRLILSLLDESSSTSAINASKILS